MGRDKITKATEYVQKSANEAQDCRYYVVLETEHGSTIVTELREDTVTWDENPVDLEDRKSLAKVVRTAPCGGSGSTVQELKNPRANALQHRPVGHGNKRRTYATRAYTIAVGGVEAALVAAEK